MTRDNNAPTGQDPIPATLLRNRRATIQFDGLIMGAYDEKRRLYQAGIHVQAEKHHVVLTVIRKEDGQQVFPKAASDWDGSHATIKALAPFWMFVDSGDGLQPEYFDASLYNLEDPRDPLSFGKVFNFEKQYGRALPLNPNRLAEFNFPNGTSYSALNTEAALARFAQSEDPLTASVVGDISVSTLGAIDIDAVSAGEAKRDLVLISSNRKEEFFRLPLVAGTTYQITVLNVPEAEPPHATPAPAGHTHTSPEQHFLQYYELFALNPGEDKFVVQPAVAPNLFGTPDSPPCIGGAGSTKGGLSGGG